MLAPIPAYRTRLRRLRTKAIDLERCILQVASSEGNQRREEGEEEDRRGRHESGQRDDEHFIASPVGGQFRLDSQARTPTEERCTY
jgi:hypothetical protein